MPTPISERRKTGNTAEQAACDLLERNGLTLIERNALFRVGEIDIIARDGNTLVFAEVRFRRTNEFGGAFASIDKRKCRKVARAAQTWLNAHPAFAKASCRFDVIAVQGDNDNLQCEWRSAAFTLDDLA